MSGAEQAVEDTGTVEVNMDSSEDIVVEVEDDTPEEDKGRPRRAKGEEADIPEDDDLQQHSESVQKRIKKLKFEYHEERRRKEEAEREREAAIQYAQSAKNEADNLRKNLSEGEGVLITQAKARNSSELTQAKAAYKQAYDAGDSDAVVEAQSAMVKLQTEADRIENWKPRSPEAPQQQQAPAARPRAPEPDKKAQEWVAKNSWFTEDKGMERYAMLVHQELVEEGVDSSSDTYYSRIDGAMRQRYPDRFDDVTEDRKPQRQAGSVVAPSGRNTATSRTTIKLTSSEAAIAKRLGVPLKDYAAQKLKELNNG